MDLNLIWFILLGILLAGYAVLDGFDLGVGMLHLLARRRGAAGFRRQHRARVGWQRGLAGHLRGGSVRRVPGGLRDHFLWLLHRIHARAAGSDFPCCVARFSQQDQVTKLA